MVEPRRRPRALALASVALLLAPAALAGNRRSFYLQMAGFGVTDGDADGPSARWARNTSWAESLLSVGVEWDVNASGVRAARDLGWSVTLATVASPQRRLRRHTLQPAKRAVSNLSTAIAAQAAAGIAGSELVWEYMCEDDSAGSGYAWDLLVAARAAGYTDGATRLKPEQASAAWREYVRDAHAAAIAHAPAARLHARLGFPQFAHSVAPFADCHLVELTNDDVGSFGPALAFLRGAARQFNTSWGIDLSMWWGVIDGCVADLPASLHRRAMALAYVGGAAIVAIEACGWVDASGQPNFIASEVDAFGRLAEPGGALPAAARAAPDVPAALVLPADLGWSERPSYAAAASTLWTYANIPANARRGAAAANGLLGAAFPGADGAFGYLAFPFGAFADEQTPPPSSFARSSITTMYAPDPKDSFQVTSPLPFGRFHDRDQLHAWFHEGGRARDPAPMRPMVDTRWGDLLDVLVADDEQRWASAAAGSGGYQALIWANSSTTDAARSALERYATGGGTVLTAVGSVGPADAALTGVSPSGEIRAVRAWRWAAEGAEASGDAELAHFLIANANITATGVQVVAVSEPEGLPIIVRRALGSGWVYTCLAPFFGADRLAPPALRLLDHVLAPLQAVSIVEGLPALYWTSTRLADGASRVAAIANNADARWDGKVRVRIGDHAGSVNCASAACEDLRSGGSIACSVERAGGRWGAVVDLGIEAHDVALVKVACRP